MNVAVDQAGANVLAAKVEPPRIDRDVELLVARSHVNDDTVGDVNRRGLLDDSINRVDKLCVLKNPRRGLALRDPRLRKLLKLLRRHGGICVRLRFEAKVEQW